MQGKFFDQLIIGEEYVTPSRTVTETDVVMFAAMPGVSGLYLRGVLIGRKEKIYNGQLGHHARRG